MELVDYAASHLQASIRNWEADGCFPPMLWAHGDRTISATPFRSDAETEHVTELLTLIGRLCDAAIIGRSAEAWIAPFESGWHRPPGNLAEQAENDPSIRTAILVQACDVETGEGVILAGITGLNDDGERWWQSTEPSHVPEHLSGEVSKALDDLQRIGPVPRHNADDIITLAESMFAGLGWVLVAS